LIFLIISSILTFNFFKPIYESTEIIIPYGVHPFDICSKNLELWQFIKTSYIFIFILSNLIISSFLYNRILLKLINYFSISTS